MYIIMANDIQRDIQILIRATAEEKAGYEAQAKQSGLTLSAWIRDRLIGKQVNGPTLPVTRAGRPVSVERPTSYSDRMRQMREDG